MMLSLKSIRQYIASLNIAENENVYIGKLDNKKQKSVGIYSRKTDGKFFIAIGGLDCSTFNIKPISLLIHWNKSQVETEEAAYKLFDRLKKQSNINIEGIHIDYLCLQVPEPQSIGTDEYGVYEYVIWLDFYYNRKDDESC